LPSGDHGSDRSPQQQQQQQQQQHEVVVQVAASPVGQPGELGSDNLDSISQCLAAASTAVLADEVTSCMQTIYEADPDVADETLLCLLDFLQRKLNPRGHRRVNCDKAAAALAQASRHSSSGSPLQLEVVSPAAAVAAAAVGLAPEDATLAAELLAAPELAFMCPRALRAAMACLSSSDLHMVLAYIVRQSGAPVPSAADDTHSSGSCGSSSSSDGCSMGTSSNAGSVSGEEDEIESGSATDSQGSDEETGCMALFQLFQKQAEGPVVDGSAEGEEQQLRLLEEGPAAAAAAPLELAAGPAAAPGSSSSKGPAPKQVRGSPQQRQQGGKAAPSGGHAKGDASKRGATQQQQQQQQIEPVLLVSPWWLEHLRQSSTGKDPAADIEADIRVLRWVYGNIESAQAEELASRQASLRGGLVRSAALLELHEGLAEGWRRMQRVIDRQGRLELLRGRVKVGYWCWAGCVFAWCAGFLPACFACARCWFAPFYPQGFAVVASIFISFLGSSFDCCIHSASRHTVSQFGTPN
jgi:hypothetical protein